jgi:hypothetical protein
MLDSRNAKLLTDKIRNIQVLYDLHITRITTLKRKATPVFFTGPNKIIRQE